jgi:hypothetical protein
MLSSISTVFKRPSRAVTVIIPWLTSNRPDEFEVSALVVKGYLPEEARGDGKAIKAGIEGVISDMAFELQQETSMKSRSRL